MTIIFEKKFSKETTTINKAVSVEVITAGRKKFYYVDRGNNTTYVYSCNEWKMVGAKKEG